jgi:hypothetical protein
VPVEDGELIDRVLSGDVPRSTSWRGRLRSFVVETVDEETIDALAASSDLDESESVAELALFEDEDTRFAPGETRPVYVWVRNVGAAWWSGAERPWGLELTYRWRTPDGDLVEEEGGRTPLTARLGPGQAQIQPVLVLAPDEPGAYRLEIEVLQEHVRRFPSALVLEVTVGGRGGASAPAGARSGVPDARPEMLDRGSEMPGAAGDVVEDGAARAFASEGR